MYLISLCLSKTLTLFFLNCSLVKKNLYVWGCCLTAWPTFSWVNWASLIDVLTFSKTGPNHGTTTTRIIDAGIRFLCWNAVFSSLPAYRFSFKPKSSILVHKIFLQQSSDFLYLYTMSLTVDWWGPNTLDRVLYPFPGRWATAILFLRSSEISIVCAMTRFHKHDQTLIDPCSLNKARHALMPIDWKHLWTDGHWFYLQINC